MSDQWKMYPCQMGPDRAWIMFDFGISKTMDAEAPPQLLQIRIAFKQQREDGMPDNSEFPQLVAIDEGVKALAQAHGALWVGRITVAGTDIFHGVGRRHLFPCGIVIRWRGHAQAVALGPNVDRTGLVEGNAVG